MGFIVSTVSNGDRFLGVAGGVYPPGLVPREPAIRITKPCGMDGWKSLSCLGYAETFPEYSGQNPPLPRPGGARAKPEIATPRPIDT
jgi:hypothetical protein